MKREPGPETDSERSERIGACERFLRELEFVRFRVRDHGDLVRIEVGPDEIERFSLPSTREAIVEKFKEIGFRFVSLELGRYRPRL